MGFFSSIPSRETRRKGGEASRTPRKTFFRVKLDGGTLREIIQKLFFADQRSRRALLDLIENLFLVFLWVMMNGGAHPALIHAHTSQQQQGTVKLRRLHLHGA